MLIFNSWYTEGRSNIYVAENDGSNLHCLTASYNLQRYQRLRISPERSRLLFLAQPPHEEAGRFFVCELESGLLKMYGQEPHPYDMRWLTQDILLCIKKDQLWTVELETAAAKEVDFGEGFLVMDVAPDGDRLLMTKGQGIGGSTYVGSIERRRVEEIVRGVEYEKSHAIVYPEAWSPNGDSIACVGGYEDEVWVVNADGSDPRKVAATDYFWRTIRWSPDGGMIAFTRSQDAGGPDAERGAVFVSDLASGEERQVLELKRGETWTWGAEGKSLICARGEQGVFSLIRVDIRTLHSSELIDVGAGLKDIAELIVV